MTSLPALPTHNIITGVKSCCFISANKNKRDMFGWNVFALKWASLSQNIGPKSFNRLPKYIKFEENENFPAVLFHWMVLLSICWRLPNRIIRTMNKVLILYTFLAYTVHTYLVVCFLYVFGQRSCWTLTLFTFKITSTLVKRYYSFTLWVWWK